MSLTFLIILSIIQGITEFLPISSSAHLILIPFFSENSYQGRSCTHQGHCRPGDCPSHFLQTLANPHSKYQS